MVRLFTEELEEPKERSVISQYLSEIGKRGGLKGGLARVKKLSAKRRKEIAEDAARARWDKKQSLQRKSKKRIIH